MTTSQTMNTDVLNKHRSRKPALSDYLSFPSVPSNLEILPCYHTRKFSKDHNSPSELFLLLLPPGCQSPQSPAYVFKL